MTVRATMRTARETTDAAASSWRRGGANAGGACGGAATDVTWDLPDASARAFVRAAPNRLYLDLADDWFKLAAEFEKR